MSKYVSNKELDTHAKSKLEINRESAYVMCETLNELNNFVNMSFSTL